MAKATKILLTLAVLLAAAALLLARWQRRDLLRPKTEMEKLYPVCVLGVSAQQGARPGQKAGIRNFFINWETSFPAGEVRAIRASGAVPMITWEPYLRDIHEKNLLAEIAAGGHDARIGEFARLSRGGPLFIRFAHEPNGDWYGWSGVRSSTATYIGAFRRVRDIFRREGSAAAFVFSVNYEDVPAEDWNRFENYYPGDEYADVIGLDAYNWKGARAGAAWQGPGRMLSSAYERSVRAFPSKPIFLTETAACRGAGDRPAWIRRLLELTGSRYPAVKAVVWFNFDKECGWALSDEESARAYYGACGRGRISCAAEGLDWLFAGRP